MQPTHQSDTKKPNSTFGMLILLAIVTMLVVSGAAYGIMEMEKNLDAVYVPFKTGYLARFDPTDPGLPPIQIIAGNVAHGKELFTICANCHSPIGSGIPGVGATLRRSRFVRLHNDSELVAFIKAGRQPGDPDSVLNLLMPPRGLKPDLTDSDIQDIVAYIRTLQAAEAGITLPETATNPPARN